MKRESDIWPSVVQLIIEILSVPSCVNTFLISPHLPNSITHSVSIGLKKQEEATLNIRLTPSIEKQINESIGGPLRKILKEPT